MAHKSYGYYTQGNTAHKIEFEPQKRTGRNANSRYNSGTAAPKRRYEEEEVPVRKKVTKKQKKQKPLSERQIRIRQKQSERARYHRQSDSMSLVTAGFLIAMVGVVLLLSVEYLNYRAEISEAKSNIRALQSNTEVLSSQNDSLQYDIEGYIDIERVIDIATNELGMTMASPDQIRYYHKDVEEFMNQYADVPET